MTPAGEKPIRVPFTVIVDGREQLPYRFEGLRADAARKRRPLEIPLERRNLSAGDYSIKGMEDLVAIERKTLEDLYSTLGQRREQFEREHDRLAELAFAAVVIEANWETILKEPPEQARLHPKVIQRTFISWQQKYGVPWWTMGSRRLAEGVTFRTLEMFWRRTIK